MSLWAALHRRRAIRSGSSRVTSPHDLLEAMFGDPRVELVTPAERTQEQVEALLPTVDLVLGDWS